MEPAHGRAPRDLVAAGGRTAESMSSEPPPVAGKANSRRPNWIAAGLGAFLLVAWFMGAFDVFLARQGLDFVVAHRCYQNILGTVWCDGPWSTNPLPDGSIETPDGFRLP